VAKIVQKIVVVVEVRMLLQWWGALSKKEQTTQPC